jgi:hypothetical protein
MPQGARDGALSALGTGLPAPAERAERVIMNLGEGGGPMSRAFVREDSGYVVPGRFGLPDRDDPRYDEAAALALLQAARDANTPSAEVATGYRWGEPRLKPHVLRILHAAEALPPDDQDRRFIRVARRFVGS